MIFRRSTAAFFAFGALAAGSSVALAAFATHGLLETMNYPPDRVRTFLDATAFQADQGIAVIAVAIVCQLLADGWARRIVQASGVLLAASVLLFPISVYSIVMGGPGGPAPVGGFSAMIGWVVFGVGGIVGAIKGDIRIGAVSSRPQPAE
ncbi:MAG: DUF423 domain-containing protein [Alphaproteobacteria bacterium]|nr:DUF423 domain-containing protein [Alphaproteobacteria bacterium]